MFIEWLKYKGRLKTFLEISPKVKSRGGRLGGMAKCAKDQVDVCNR